MALNIRRRVQAAGVWRADRSQPRLGASDCERLRTGLLAQPFNALTGLAFLPAGVRIVRLGLSASQPGTGLVTLGASVAGNALGSFVFHGPQPRGARWLHDAAIGSTLLSLSPGAEAHPLALRGLAALLLAHSGISTLVLGVLAARAGAREVAAYRRGLRPRRDAMPRRSAAYRRALAAWGAAGVALLAGRSGSPLCAPDRLVQAHGLWHLLAATGCDAYAHALTPA
jgi:hypothetical protein